MKLTFQESELENGDIICFQKDSSMDIVKQICFPDVSLYLEYVHKRYPYVASSFEYICAQSPGSFLSPRHRI
ncbi:putative ubiquitin carboxyl-terminal hydrolase 7, ICP0-binding domain-containing protein [Medicago truncatula]|uniref:Putative ubiquitin carboxyl-terminal hydrolase 7, ICP0-binding domain-containing protein n=1 Tax=Medicago truncatula TaxID=3880 RepID=A0A396HW77_MEDTR|nr:putative ubiquitin carboxyl-terminal hydrolase 7, ICP0-binding domain-containing protein [Medicago truncatula]